MSCLVVGLEWVAPVSDFLSSYILVRESNQRDNHFKILADVLRKGIGPGFPFVVGGGGVLMSSSLQLHQNSRPAIKESQWTGLTGRELELEFSSSMSSYFSSLFSSLAELPLFLQVHPSVGATPNDWGTWWGALLLLGAPRGYICLNYVKLT